MTIGGFDGTIRIDSSISPKGFNNGIKRIGLSTKKVFSEIARTVKSKLFTALLGVLAVLGTISVVVGGIVTGIFVLVRIGSAIFKVFEKSVAPASKLHDQITEMRTAFDDLKGALIAAFSPLITAALPYIITITNWLVRMLNLLTMIMAAFLGQKTVMISVGKAATAASGAISKAAKDARGALAAFDQLNVLAQPDEDAGGAGGIGGGGEFLFEEVDIEEGILEKVNRIKKWFKDMWETIKKWGLKAWEIISVGAAKSWEILTLIWGLVWPWFKEHVVDPIGAGFLFLWDKIKLGLGFLWRVIVSIWGVVAPWFQEHVIDPIWKFFLWLIERLGIIWGNVWATIKFMWGIVATWFWNNVILPVLKGFTILGRALWFGFLVTWGIIKGIWNVAKTWFKDNVIDPLENAFFVMLDAINEKFGTTFSSLADIAKGAINLIIGFLNSMISGVVSGINSIARSANQFGSAIPGWQNIPAITAPKIPRLARGAVIPPNAAFAAILGDQTSGKNIEAPESLIRQIFREEMGDGGDTQITVRFEGTMGALIRELQPRIKRETKRRGKSLLTGGVTE